MIHKAMHGEPLSIWGNPNKVRDVVYVKDCSQIIEKCISTADAPNGTYNVGTGIGTTMEEQVRGIVEIFSPKNASSEISYDSAKPDAVEYVFDMSKVEKFLGYKPQYDYIAYLKDFKAEMQQQRFEKLSGRDLVEQI